MGDCIFIVGGWDCEEPPTLLLREGAEPPSLPRRVGCGFAESELEMRMLTSWESNIWRICSVQFPSSLVGVGEVVGVVVDDVLL
jgi:hypothetical protein